MIRKARKNDAEKILDIYSFYVIHTRVSFELVPPDLQYMEEKISQSKLPWLVYEHDKEVVGYAYAIHWKTREAYKRSVETSIYLSKDHLGKGIGKKLYAALLELLQKEGFHAIIGGVSLPNEASVRLHESLGFEKIAQFREVGFKFGQWIDVGYWELIFD